MYLFNGQKRTEQYFVVLTLGKMFLTEECRLFFIVFDVSLS